MAAYNHTLMCPRDSQILLRIINGSRSGWKSEAASGSYNLSCKICGGVYAIKDDGVPANSGGGIELDDRSTPTIESISPDNGQLIGGTEVIITGQCFESATPQILIAGAPCTNIVVESDTQLTAKTPQGSIELMAAAQVSQRLLTENVVGDFVQNEVVVGSISGNRGAVTQIGGGAFLMVDAPHGKFLAGETITGERSGAKSALRADSETIEFIVGETLTGELSGASCVARSNLPIKVDTVLGQFVADEYVTGRTSGARLRLAAPPINRLADVVVSNEWGQRSDGGNIADAFSYLL